MMDFCIVFTGDLLTAQELAVKIIYIKNCSGRAISFMEQAVQVKDLVVACTELGYILFFISAYILFDLDSERFIPRVICFDYLGALFTGCQARCKQRHQHSGSKHSS